ncbi:hypothetical protein AB1Y20_010433 [Prymnesium parvum]|uniref:Uncharacterized protein n=1 Tax=Prymnesium parvum TaxID=97485 RepID=A0AB34IR37_PRYPA
MPRSTILTQQADSFRFQAWIRRIQYPRDCRATTGAITRRDYFYVLGLGAQMVSMKFNFVHSLLQGMVYHLPTTHYANPLRCPSRSFDCYFEPPTNCSTAQHARTLDVKIHWCFDIPRRRLTRMARLRAVHSSAWYHAQLSAFLFRPNAAMREYIEASRAGMEYANVQNRTRSVSTHRGANSSCVAMHIRRTDKHSEDHRTKERGFQDFVHIYKSWAYWSYPGVPSQLQVLLGSEDKTTFTKMPRLLSPSLVYWLPSRLFVMDSTAGKRFINIKQGNHRLAELYGLQEDEAEADRKAGRPPNPSLRKDEGMALIAQILLMSQCDVFIGSYSSNVAILVHDLLLARKVALHEEAISLDVNGRTYCGCGASFCMQIERKLEKGYSLGSTPLTAKQLVEKFQY